MNLSVLLDMAADGFGDRVIAGSRDLGFTASRIRRLSIGGSNLLRESHAEALIYFGLNGPMFPVALFAAARAGVPLVPINYRLGDEQLKQLLAHHPGALALTGAEHRDRLQTAGLNTITFDDWLDKVDSLGGEDEEPAETGNPAALIYTSGTTSQPKGVVLRHENLISYVLGTVEFASADESDAALISVPPYHIAAVANAITNLYAGRRIVVLEQFTAQEWLDTVRSQRITNALVVPTMLARIVAAPSEQLEVPSLRALAYGGAPMPVRVVECALRMWPHVDFVNAYGLTETSSTIAVLGPEDHRAALTSSDPQVRARLESVGTAVPMIEIKVRNDSGGEAPAGQVGRIWVRGAQVSGEYAGSGKVTDDDGWFDTRDQGYLDGASYLYIGGRADDTIIRGAENIAPAEIEDVLLAHPDVEDAVVVGIPDEEWGHRIEAAVVLRADGTATPEQLQDHVRSRLRRSKTPDRIVFWDEVPRTETGKLVRRSAVDRIVNGPLA
jgi:acyl-CoA synthetase (AMP-forming)/AMP-acid ligase II